VKKLFLAIIVLCFLMIGCAAWQKAVNEVTPTQQTQMQATIAPATAAIPQPYQLPAAVIGGWLACILFNLGKDWWDKKTNPKV
jgi:hypothetical protein